MHPHGVGLAQPAGVVATGDIQALVPAALHAPDLAVAVPPVQSTQLFGGQAGEQFALLGLVATQVPMEPGGLRDQREAGWFGSEGGALQETVFVAAFVFFRAWRHRSGWSV